MSALYKTLVDELNINEVSYEIIEHSEITCVEDGVNLLNLPEDSILKTIGFETSGGVGFAVLQGRMRIDYKKLTSVLKVKRESIKMLPLKIVEDELGYQAGGLSPIHRDNRITVYMDINISDLGLVYCGIGERTKTLKILSKDLIKASKAKLADIAK